MTARPLTPEEIEAVRQLQLPCHFCTTGTPGYRFLVASKVIERQVVVLVCKVCAKDRKAEIPKETRRNRS